MMSSRPPILPIRDCEHELVARLRENMRAIVTAPTGSGKSTQVPQMLLDHGLLGSGQVVVLQPRRLAARMLAARVASERGGRLGSEVGYQIRFDDVSSPATRIKYVTEGILLRQMMAQPELNGISAVVFDEFHERHLYGDLTLAWALDVQQRCRPDLRMLVMSATLDVAPLQRYLHPCAVLHAEGRTFPVDIEFLPKPLNPREPVWDAAVKTLEQVTLQGEEGDVLIFMPGAYEIRRTVQALEASPFSRSLAVLPLHGELPPDQQDAAVCRSDRRKVVVATNVAETSITIDGIRLVIDSGLARIPRFDPYRGINTLLIENISRASADQRAGRAGRTEPGRCLRLWTAAEHRGRAAHEVPEVRRLDLAEAVLMLKAVGAGNMRTFRWFEPPEEKTLERAERLLQDLGALKRETGELTALGRRMAAFPLHPRYARMLLAASDRSCVRPVALIAALTQGRDLLVRRAGRDVTDQREDALGEEAASDFFVLMRAWNYADRHGYRLAACRRLGIHAQTARQVRPLFDHFLRIARVEGLSQDEQAPDDEAVQKCVLAGFVDQVARRIDTGTLRCRLVHNRRGVLARESAVRRAPLLVAADVREVEGRDREVNVLLSLATAIQPEWLAELAPHDFSRHIDVRYDESIRRVVAEEQVHFRDLILEARQIDPPPVEEAADRLAEEVVKGRLTLKQWDHAVEQWILRVGRLSQWCPELGLPNLTEEHRHAIIREICHGAVSYKDIKDRPVWTTVRTLLSRDQQVLLEKHAPERLELPGGRRVKVSYTQDRPPTIAVRIQDLYDVTQGFRIAMGRVPVVIQVLAPNQRPVQITQDLAAFWRDQYPKVKRELQRKYPKHEWR